MQVTRIGGAGNEIFTIVCQTVSGIVIERNGIYWEDAPLYFRELYDHEKPNWIDSDTRAVLKNSGISEEEYLKGREKSRRATGVTK